MEHVVEVWDLVVEGAAILGTAFLLIAAFLIMLGAVRKRQ